MDANTNRLINPEAGTFTFSTIPHHVCRSLLTASLSRPYPEGKRNLWQTRDFYKHLTHPLKQQ